MKIRSAIPEFFLSVRTDGRTDERTQQRGYRNRSPCMRTLLKCKLILYIFQWISLQPVISISQQRPPGARRRRNSN